MGGVLRLTLEDVDRVGGLGGPEDALLTGGTLAAGTAQLYNCVISGYPADCRLQILQDVFCHVPSAKLTSVSIMVMNPPTGPTVGCSLEYFW